LSDLQERAPLSKNALPITVIISSWISFNFLPDRTRNGN